MNVKLHQAGMLSSAGRGRRARRGSVIVVVLITLLLASLMLTKFIENSAVELTLATRHADRTRLRGDAYGALETALAVMAEFKFVEENLYSPAQGWGDPYGYSGEAPREGVTVEFAFTDESGKASLPNLSFEDMVELAQVLGLGEHDARRFADGLYVWIRSDHTPQEIEAEASRYERESIRHEPPKRSLRSWDELRAVHVARDYVYDENGALTPFGVALRQNLSLYQFESSNVNALAPALGTARGWDDTQNANVATYHEGRIARPAGAPPWFRSPADLTAVVGANTDIEGLDAVAKLLRIDVTVREGAASMRLSALVALDSSVSLPPAYSADGTEPADAGQGSRTGQNNGGQRPRFGAQQTRPGGSRSTTRETSGTGATSEERLDYPFTILEVIEFAGPEPVPAADEAEEAPQS